MMLGDAVIFFYLYNKENENKFRVLLDLIRVRDRIKDREQVYDVRV